VLLVNSSGTKAFDYDSILSLTLKLWEENRIAVILTTKPKGLIIPFDEFENAEAAVDFLRKSVMQINEYREEATICSIFRRLPAARGE